MYPFVNDKKHHRKPDNTGDSTDVSFGEPGSGGKAERIRPEKHSTHTTENRFNRPRKEKHR